MRFIRRRGKNHEEEQTNSRGTDDCKCKASSCFRSGEDNGCAVYIYEDIDVKAIRKKVNMSQSEFANLFGLNKRTLEHWEHGRRVPSGTARAFLTIIAREPEAVRRALMSNENQVA